MFQFSHQTKLVEETTGLKSCLHKRVLTPKGYIVGTVKDVRVDEKAHHFEGIVIGKLFQKPFFISRDYVHTISADTIVLKEELITLYKGRELISFEGKSLGTVIGVERIGNTNKLSSILVRKKGLMRKHKTINVDQIAHIGASIILKEHAKY